MYNVQVLYMRKEKEHMFTHCIVHVHVQVHTYIHIQYVFLVHYTTIWFVYLPHRTSLLSHCKRCLFPEHAPQQHHSSPLQHMHHSSPLQHTTERYITCIHTKHIPIHIMRRPGSLPPSRQGGSKVTLQL